MKTDTFFPKNAGFIDYNIIYPIASLFITPLYKLSFTPNIITTIEGTGYYPQAKRNFLLGLTLKL